ncbi:hypothetical protein JOF41_005433 [Saccharothrix coeruleofusca]|uniref:hypothetical protein n=1 Tax=Saccharothrix coeruleofusca TaxID=33919 RepID=UPI001AEB9BA3|nr:hypothetical protein [Saccharothrix coeruleofusca]MBP2339255.1 hypothetical protein [Saccharothrix coeruleofusca]
MRLGARWAGVVVELLRRVISLGMLGLVALRDRPAAGVDMPNVTNIICGIVNPDGSIYSGSGFQVEKRSNGQYLITFSVAYAKVPAVVASTCTFSTLWNGLDVSSVAHPSTSSCTVLTHDNVGNLADRPFTFMAAG